MRFTHRWRSTAVALGIVVLASLGLLAIAAGSAGAQTVDFCQFTVSPVTLPTGGGNVTVAGTAPADSEVRIFANGVFVTSTHTDAVTGAYSVTFHLNQTSEIGVSIDDYPATGCGVSPEQANRNANAARGNLPRTGGSHIESNLLLGLALVLVGAVLVVAVRRYDSVQGRGQHKS
jgi:LPXTG-motif cell wall-anchored protein